MSEVQVERVLLRHDLRKVFFHIFPEKDIYTVFSGKGKANIQVNHLTTTCKVNWNPTMTASEAPLFERILLYKVCPVSITSESMDTGRDNIGKGWAGLHRNSIVCTHEKEVILGDFLPDSIQ